MKFLHLGDLHLGKSLGDFDLIDDQKYILKQILDICEQKSVDAVLVAGDVYDKAIPSEAAVRLFDSFLFNLVSRKIKAYVISGNHDSAGRLNFGARLFEKNDVHIAAVSDGTVYKSVFEDESGEVNFYLMPFVKASQVRHFYPEEKITTYDEAFRVLVKHADIDPSKRNVMVAHQFVAGRNSEPELGGSEGLATQSVGTLERVGADCFDAFDYVALGHIHSAQGIGREEVRYSGSPLKYSLSEVNNQKSVPVVTMGAKGDVNIELVPLIPRRDLRHIKGALAVLTDKANVVDPDDYIYATLTDEDMANDVMAYFQQFYPNTVKIDYDNSRTRAVDYVDIEEITKSKSFEELIGEFYQLMYGVKISAEEMEIMENAAKEAHVIDETD